MVEDCKTILLYEDGPVDTLDDCIKNDNYFKSVIDPAKNDLFMVLSKVYWAMWW
jgi:hypothetical protein